LGTGLGERIDFEFGIRFATSLAFFAQGCFEWPSDVNRVFRKKKEGSRRASGATQPGIGQK
jgi:hypothetical protein